MWLLDGFTDLQTVQKSSVWVPVISNESLFLILNGNPTITAAAVTFMQVAW